MADEVQAVVPVRDSGRALRAPDDLMVRAGRAPFPLVGIRALFAPHDRLVTDLALAKFRHQGGGHLLVHGQIPPQSPRPRAASYANSSSSRPAARSVHFCSFVHSNSRPAGHASLMSTSLRQRQQVTTWCWHPVIAVTLAAVISARCCGSSGSDRRGGSVPPAKSCLRLRTAARMAVTVHLRRAVSPGPRPPLPRTSCAVRPLSSPSE